MCTCIRTTRLQPPGGPTHFTSDFVPESAAPKNANRSFFFEIIFSEIPSFSPPPPPSSRCVCGKRRVAPLFHFWNFTILHSLRFSLFFGAGRVALLPLLFLFLLLLFLLQNPGCLCSDSPRFRLPFLPPPLFLLWNYMPKPPFLAGCFSFLQAALRVCLPSKKWPRSLFPCPADCTVLNFFPFTHNPIPPPRPKTKKKSWRLIRSPKKKSFFPGWGGVVKVKTFLGKFPP